MMDPNSIFLTEVCNNSDTVSLFYSGYVRIRSHAKQKTEYTNNDLNLTFIFVHSTRASTMPGKKNTLGVCTCAEHWQRSCLICSRFGPWFGNPSLHHLQEPRFCLRTLIYWLSCAVVSKFCLQALSQWWAYPTKTSSGVDKLYESRWKPLQYQSRPLILCFLHVFFRTATCDLTKQGKCETQEKHDEVTATMQWTHWSKMVHMKTHVKPLLLVTNMCLLWYT